MPAERDFAGQLADPAFAAVVVEALRAGTLPGNLEAAFWRLAWGAPDCENGRDEASGEDSDLLTRPAGAGLLRR